MKLVDRPVDFYRRRLTRCAACQHEEFFDGDWYDRDTGRSPALI